MPAVDWLTRRNLVQGSPSQVQVLPEARVYIMMYIALWPDRVPEGVLVFLATHLMGREHEGLPEN